MREKLQSLPIVELREIAKANGIKSVTTMRKASLIEKILEVNGSIADSASASDDKQSTSTSDLTEDTYSKSSTSSDESAQSLSHTGYTEGRNRVYTTQSRAYDKLTYERPQQERPAFRERASYERPTYERTSYDRGGYERASYERAPRPVYERQGYERNNYERTYDRVSYEKPTYERTNIDELGYDPNLDSGIEANGILEVMPDGFGFIRCENYMPGDNDVYVSPMQIRKFNLKTGDIIIGKLKIKTTSEKFAALLYIISVNGYTLDAVTARPNFEDLTPIFPNEKIKMETDSHNTAMRILDIVSPIGKGQRGMIVSPPKAGKTTLLKEIAKSITTNNPEMHMIILLIDERPEEVTDIKEAIEGKNVEVIYSTFDELPEHHKRVSEMVIERGKRLVEHGNDVVILLDSITRLARAYNLTVTASGRTLSGGLDPAALHMPKKFFGAARNMREGGSLTILSTALVETGSKMDDVVFEEFKGTGNMELVLNRKLSEKRVFPAIDILKSGTRRDDLLLSESELEASNIIKRISANARTEDSVENVLNLFAKTSTNEEFCNTIVKQKI